MQTNLVRNSDSYFLKLHKDHVLITNEVTGDF